jgi:hypothetical protein
MDNRRFGKYTNKQNMLKDFSFFKYIGPSYVMGHLTCPECDPNHSYMNLQSHTVDDLMDDLMDDFVDLEKLI